MAATVQGFHTISRGRGCYRPILYRLEAEVQRRSWFQSTVFNQRTPDFSPGPVLTLCAPWDKACVTQPLGRMCTMEWLVSSQEEGGTGRAGPGLRYVCVF